MEELKKATISSIVLQFKDLEKIFAVYTDASGFAFGAILQQEFGKRL